MLNSHSKVNRAGLRRLFALAIGLAMIGIALLPNQSSSSAAPASTEKRNVRISTRAAERQATEYARRSRMMSPMSLAAITVDRTDDVAAASACTAAANDCSLRGAVAFANANPGTTISVPAGTYNLAISGAGEGFNGDNLIGDLDITGNNTSVSGAGAATTIIHQTSAGDRVIEVNPFLDASFITSISGVTISGGSESTGVGGGGIISGSIDNVLTLTDCVISGNSATGVGTLGGGGVSHMGGSLTITGCTFSGNSTSTSGGGVGYTAGDPLIRQPSNGTLTVSGSTFSNNTANSTAAGGGGADLFNFNASIGAYNISTSSFSGNSAAGGNGGAIIVESGPLALTTSSLSGNSAATFGGAVYSSGSAAITFSRLVGNTVPTPANGLTLFSAAGTFTANDNWWGINTGPSVNDFRNTGGTVTPLTWLQLQASASPNSVCANGTSTIAANIKKRNAGPDLTVELTGLPPFPASFVNATPALGSLSGASANFVDGAASATFTAGATSGTANIDVIADNQTVTASVNIGGNTTSDPADQTVCEGGTATFTTTASGSGPFTFVWKKGSTVLNNGDLGGRVSIVSGPTSSTLTISNVQASDADTYTVEATGACSTASQSASLTVNAATATTDPADQQVCQGGTANFSTTASGSGPFSFVWKKGATVLNNGDLGGRVTITTGPTSSTLSISNVQASDADTYTVETTGACNTATQSANLTVGGNQVTAVGPANVWIGLRTSDDVGTKFDLLAEVFKDNVLIGSGQLNDVPGGSSGFNNAVQDTINMALTGSGDFCSGGTLSFRLSVRVAASSSHVNGTARLWYNDAAANSRFNITIGGTTTYYLRDGFVLATTPGPGPKKTIDVSVNRNQGGNPFKPFGTWSITF